MFSHSLPRVSLSLSLSLSLSVCVCVCVCVCVRVRARAQVHAWVWPSWMCELCHQHCTIPVLCSATPRVSSHRHHNIWQDDANIVWELRPMWPNTCVSISSKTRIELKIELKKLHKNTLQQTASGAASVIPSHIAYTHVTHPSHCNYCETHHTSESVFGVTRTLRPEQATRMMKMRI